MHYVWYVYGVDAQGQGQWSMGSSFQVEASALSVEQQDAVKEVVKGYLEGDSANGGATEGGTAGGAAEVKTFSGITPMGLEGPTNTFYGTSAGSGITSGTDDTFVGAYAGAANTTGYENSFFGRGAGGANTWGYYNSFVGAYAGNKNTTGDYNSFVGAHAGNKNTTGNANSFVGAGAGGANTTGYSNSFFGRHAGVANTTGYSNSFFGRDAGATNTTGYYNVFLGYEAGYSETNSNKLYIDNCYTGGNCTQPLIYGEFDNRVVRIDGSLTIVTVATPSDMRYKKEIHPLESPLEKVLELRGVTYEWDKDKVNGAGYKSGKQIGLIAQEVEKVLPELVQTDSKGYKTLSYDKLGPVLIEAVKEQQKEIREKDARIERLEKALEDQQQAIASLMERLVSLENPSKTLALK
jgi:hypothetical protein